MNESDLENTLIAAVANIQGTADDSAEHAKAWSELAKALEALDRITVRYGEDNTFSLRYFVSIQQGWLGRASTEHQEMVKWCDEHYGVHWDIDNIRGTWAYDMEGTFHFKNEQDRTMFMLRWAQ